MSRLSGDFVRISQQGADNGNGVCACLQDIQERALHAIERTAAQRLLLDITGIPIVDTQVAKGLIAIVQAARLLGAEVLLVGIRSEVAQTIVGLGLDLRGLVTCADLQSGVGYALQQG